MNMLVNVVIPSFVVFALILAYKRFPQRNIDDNCELLDVVSHEKYVDDLFRQIDNV